MLLKALYDFAVSHRLLDDLAFKKDTPVRFVIALDRDGNLLGVKDTATETQKKGAPCDTPKSSRPNNSGLVSDFLVDEISAILGLSTKPEKALNERETAKLAGKHLDFWRQAETAALRDNLASLLRPVLRFRDSLTPGDPPPFLTRDGKNWHVALFSGTSTKLGADLFTFEVDGARLILDERIRSYWAEAFRAESASTEEASQKGVCLVTGETDTPLARTHAPMVTGLPPPARATGAGLVSGDKEAFLSYGLDQALNAPTSIAASRAYLRALQHMVGHEDHFYRMGPAWLMFWTEKTKFPARQLLQRPSPQAVTDLMKSAWSGLEKSSERAEKFTAITLTAAGPRLVVKDWLQITLHQAVENLRQWFRDLEIDSVDFGPALHESGASARKKVHPTAGEDFAPAPYSIYNLAKMTVRPNSEGRYGSKELEKLDANLLAALYSAALKAEKPPRALLAPLLDRLRARMARDGRAALNEQSRFALLRLILNRYPHTMTIEPKLSDTTDTAYNCGRLLSIFNTLQRRAHSTGEGGGKLNTTLAERYFASASASPNAAFAIMWRLHQSHLKKLRQGGESGEKAAAGFKRSIMDICARFQAAPGLCPTFPRVFKLEEQGRFALGYYQQEAARAEAIRRWKDQQLKEGKRPPATDDEAPLEAELPDSDPNRSTP